MAHNQNQINNNPALNQMIAPVSQIELNASTPMKKDENKFCKKEVRFFLYISSPLLSMKCLNTLSINLSN